jgi:hypothetical protein
LTDTDRDTQIVQEVHADFVQRGLAHVPPDDTSEDDELAFWAEVDLRRAAIAPRLPEVAE